MLTGAEKGYLAMTLFFLATGSGIKAFRLASVEIGPAPDGDPSLSEAASRGPSTSPDTASPDPVRSEVMDSSLADSARGPESPAAPQRDASIMGHEAATSPPFPPKRPASGRKAGFAGKVSLNRAEASELTSVPGLGDKTARAIVEYRRTHGPYRGLRDLLLVKGIGEKKLEKLIPYLIL